MPENDKIPTGQDGPDDDTWNVVLDDEFIRSATVKEPAAIARRRVWPRNAALASIRQRGSIADRPGGSPVMSLAGVGRAVA